MSTNYNNEIYNLYRAFLISDNRTGPMANSPLSPNFKFIPKSILVIARKGIFKYRSIKL